MNKYKYAVGRRKEAVATVRLFDGEGESLINDKPVEKFVNSITEKRDLYKPLSKTGKMKDYHFTIKVKGGGSKGQIGAAIHGIARALLAADPDTKDTLKKEGLLTRDDRKKERKKTGLLKARKAPQFSKR